MIPFAFLQFARAYEQEADQLAVRMMAGAGFDPEALANYYRRVWTDNPPAAAARFLDPTGSRETRIAAMERAIQESKPPAGSASGGEFLRIKEHIPAPQALPAPAPPSLERQPK